MELSESLQKKLDSLRERYEEVSSLLSQPEIVSDREKYASLSREFSELEPLILSFNAFSKLKSDLTENESMLSEADSELRDLVEIEIEDVKKQNNGEKVDDEKVLETYRPSAERNLKWFLIRKKISIYGSVF